MYHVHVSICAFKEKYKKKLNDLTSFFMLLHAFDLLLAYS